MSYFSSLEKYAQLNGFRKYTWGEGGGKCGFWGRLFYFAILFYKLYNIFSFDPSTIRTYTEKKYKVQL